MILQYTRDLVDCMRYLGHEIVSHSRVLDVMKPSSFAWSFSVVPTPVLYIVLENVVHA